MGSLSSTSLLGNFLGSCFLGRSLWSSSFLWGSVSWSGSNSWGSNSWGSLLGDSLSSLLGDSLSDFLGACSFLGSLNLSWFLCCSYSCYNKELESVDIDNIIFAITLIISILSLIPILFQRILLYSHPIQLLLYDNGRRESYQSIASVKKASTYPLWLKVILDSSTHNHNFSL